MGVYMGYPTPDTAPIPTPRPGGLGGLGGAVPQPAQQPSFLQSDNFGNILQAVGTSLMSSPYNAPLAGFGNALQGAQRDSALRQEQRQQQAAMGSTKKWLIDQGISEAEADAAIANPPILNAIIKRMQGGDRQGLMNTGEGIYDPNTGQWIMPPGAGEDNEYAKRAAAASAFGLTADDPRYENFVLTGKMSREDAQALTATDKKALWAAEDEIPAIDNTIDSLERAKELNDKTFTGIGASTAGWIGTAVPGGGYLVDEDKAAATAEFGKLMSMEAIQAMAQTLKGATTDSELARFVDILADPSTPPDIRSRTIERMKSLAERVKQIKVGRIRAISGEQPPATMPGIPAAPSGVVDYSDYFGAP